MQTADRLGAVADQAAAVKETLREMRDRLLLIHDHDRHAFDAAIAGAAACESASRALQSLALTAAAERQA